MSNLPSPWGVRPGRTYVEQYKRLLKAIKLADVLWVNHRGDYAQSMEFWGNLDPDTYQSSVCRDYLLQLWEATAITAGTRPPSHRTKRLVVKMLKNRTRWMRRVGR